MDRFAGACPDSRKCSKKVKVRCGCGNKSEEWVCEDVQREKEKRGTLRLRKEVEEEVARGKAKSRNENALLGCTAECEEYKKKREAERLEEERVKQEEQRKRKEREAEEKRNASSRGKKGGAQAIKRTSAKWREGQEQDEGRSYGWWLKAVLVSAVVVLLIALIVAAVIQSEWRGTTLALPL
jgi:hypothetical protein